MVCGFLGAPRSVAIITISMACLSPGVTGQVEPPVDPESYAVYRVAIPAKAKRIILRDQTVTKSNCFPTGRALREEWKPVVDDFRLQNSQPRTLQAGFDIGRDYLLVPDGEIERMFRGTPPGDWSVFYARYPDSGGFTEVSAVGFDPATTRAMVYVANRCGELCGSGTYHLLEKIEGLWRGAVIKDLEHCRWVS
jgi:hypothetical protein